MSAASETTPRKRVEDEETDHDNSDGELEIVIESPARKKRPKLEFNENEKSIIQSVEGSIEKCIEEKAAKTNLNVNAVKKLLKQVVTNEHVLALVKQYENPDENNDCLSVFEPKLTRAKAKELYSSPAAPANITNSVLPWTSSKPISEVQALISDELQEDSSGDEYVPEESEDDRESTAFSESRDPPSVPSLPPTTPTKDTVGTQTAWTDDGVFRIPGDRERERAEAEAERAAIALRTRSKLSLSSTPLEDIEGAFMPPDITTGMYDMNCDDDDWTDFLKTFTKPLDELTRAPDDEDHDPEYNILADEEIDLVDKEELREDRAVKISRKELNNLMQELVEFADIYESREIERRIRESAAEQQQQEALPDLDVSQQLDTTLESETHADSDKELEATTCESPCKKKIKTKEEKLEYHNLIAAEHIPLLEQQMRQHVQMLTQTYLLTFQHPTLSNYADQVKEFLLNFKYLPGNKENSYFNTVNLAPALKLIENWEQKFITNDAEADNTVSHFKKTTADAFQAKLRGHHYVLTFPEPLLRTISSSEVFLYPHLLPRIPFYSPNTFLPGHTFNAHENQLIALGLEQFVPHLEKDKATRTRNGDANLKCVTREIHTHILCGLGTSEKLYSHILKLKNAKGEQNPINYYFKNKRAPPTVHYVFPLNELGTLPPCRRPAHLLPNPWKKYVHKDVEKPVPLVFQSAPTALIQVVNVQAPYQLINGLFGQNSSDQRLLLPKQPLLQLPPITQTPRRKVWTSRRRTNIVRSYYANIFQSKFAAIIKKAAPLDKLLTVRHRLLDKDHDVNCRTCRSQSLEDMLPSMPSLLMDTATATEVHTGSGEFRCDQEMAVERETCSDVATSDADLLKNLSPFLNIGKKPVNIANSSTDAVNDMPSTSACLSDVVISQPRSSQEKDNMDEINAFMKASSKIRKEPSGAEKKRLRIKREFLNNLRMVTPDRQDDIDKHYENFALSYYKKLQEVLNQEDYRKVIEILVNVDVSRTDAVDIYNQIIRILHPKYKELAEEFLVFLNDVQALTVGKLVPYYMIKNMLLFLHKVDVYFQDKPSQARKIYSTLMELGDAENVTIDRLKSKILPLLKGNTYLADLFLQNFITEHPPDSLIVDKFETIDITKEVTNEEEMFESIVIPDDEDKYGNSNCICECHNDTTDVEASIRKKHCIPCGTRYLQGKIFIQTGKGLRPATVRFLTKTLKEQKQRLNESPTQSKKRTESTSKRSSSPMKECHDESRVCKKKEDEGGGRKKTRAKSPKKVTKKTVKPKPCKKTPTARQKNSQNFCDKKADNLGVNSVNKSSRLSKTKSSKDTPSNKTTKSKRGVEKTAGTSNDKPVNCEKVSARLKEKVARASEKTVRSAERNTSIREKLASPSSKGNSPGDKTSSSSVKSSSPNETIGTPSPKTGSYNAKTGSPNTKSSCSSTKTSDSSPNMSSPTTKTGGSPSQKTSSPSEPISSLSEQISSPSDNIGSSSVPEIPLKSSGACTQKRCAEEPLEFDLNTSAESVIDLKLSSAESESEFCEESSQANTASDAEDSSASSVVFEEIVDTDEVDIVSDAAWTREEDKTILETFRKESNKDNVFQVISKCLPNRTIYQIKSRFQKLMSLIQQMTSEAEGS